MCEFSDLELYSMVLSNYEIIEKLGEGSMGKVYLAEHKTNGKLYALKIIPDEHTLTVSKNFNIAKTLIHPNLIRCYGYFMGIYDNELHCICVMEYIQGYDLYQMFLDNDSIRPFDQLPDIIRQITLGLQYIHSAGYVHRDIKVENILVSIQGIVKIIDYDFITRRQINDEINGTPYYLAPELLTISLICQTNDMWALGVILYLLFTSLYPFDTQEDFSDDLKPEDIDILCHRIINQPIDFRGIPVKYIPIVSRLLRKDHRIRLSAKQLLTILDKWDLPNLERKKSLSICQKYHKSKIRPKSVG